MTFVTFVTFVTSVTAVRALHAVRAMTAAPLRPGGSAVTAVIAVAILHDVHDRGPEGAGPAGSIRIVWCSVRSPPQPYSWSGLVCALVCARRDRMRVCHAATAILRRDPEVALTIENVPRPIYGPAAGQQCHADTGARI